MARAKPKNLHPVRDAAEADRVMAEIAALKRSMADIEREMNNDIDAIKARGQVAMAPRKARLAALENGLLAFAEYNKDALFADKRSLELDYGALGFRRSSEIKPETRKTWKMVLGAIKDMGFEDALRIKEDVNKETLRMWPEERLALVGARRVEKDAFWYELNEATLSAEAEAAPPLVPDAV